MGAISTVNIIVLIISFCLWVLFVYKLHKDNLYFFRFLVGSVGLFLFLAILREYTFEPFLMDITIKSLNTLGNVSGLFSVSLNDSMLTVKEGAEKLSLFISSQSSGIIEIMGYASLLIFFPLHKPLKKVFLLIAGTISFMFVNVFRIIILCLMVKLLGINSYNFIEIVFTRAIFLFFMIIFYYFVFTKPHIDSQKVGG